MKIKKTALSLSISEKVMYTFFKNQDLKKISTFSARSFFVDYERHNFYKHFVKIKIALYLPISEKVIDTFFKNIDLKKIASAF